MKAFLVLLAAAAALLHTSCSTAPSKDERSAAINATGAASIENWSSPFLKTTRVFVLQIDGKFLQSGGKRGVYPLAPGKHTLEVHCHFSRLVPRLIIDAGVLKVELPAEAGIGYRLCGEKVGELVAEVWIENVATGGDVVSRTRVELTANPQEVPVFVVIPT